MWLQSFNSSHIINTLADEAQHSVWVFLKVYTVSRSGDVLKKCPIQYTQNSLFWPPVAILWCSWVLLVYDRPSTMFVNSSLNGESHSFSIKVVTEVSRQMWFKWPFSLIRYYFFIILQTSTCTQLNTLLSTCQWNSTSFNTKWQRLHWLEMQVQKLKFIAVSSTSSGGRYCPAQGPLGQWLVKNQDSMPAEIFYFCIACLCLIIP